MPGLNFEAYTRVEDNALIKAVAEHGCKWVTIAGVMTNRSQNSVKNRYHTLSKSKKHERWLTDSAQTAMDELAK